MASGKILVAQGGGPTAVINQSLAATITASPLLQQRARNERAQVDDVAFTGAAAIGRGPRCASVARCALDEPSQDPEHFWVARIVPDAK